MNKEKKQKIVISFIRFLKEKGLYRKYVRNFNLIGGFKYPTKSMYNHLLRMSTASFILSSFNWDNTLEGRDYWRLVDRAWTDLLIKHYYDIDLLN